MVERMDSRLPRAGRVVAVAVSILGFATMSAGVADAAFGIVLDKTTVERGELLVVRVPGARPQANEPSMAVVLARGVDTRRFGRWPHPAVLTAGTVRLNVTFGPERMFPKPGATPVKLVFLGYVRFDRQGHALLRVRVPNLAPGSYATFLYCRQCGPSLIPGKPLRIR
jgi:hypothetical protein